MSRHNDMLPLAHMVEHVRRALRFIEGRTYAEFVENEMLHAAVIRQVEIVGEASARVSQAFRSAHPDWPWRQMKDIRNHLIHGYDKVNLQIVWQTVSERFPELLRLLEEEEAKRLGTDIDR
jgi:uncharacterized protein with HEPN domain